MHNALKKKTKNATHKQSKLIIHIFFFLLIKFSRQPNSGVWLDLDLSSHGLEFGVVIFVVVVTVGGDGGEVGVGVRLRLVFHVSESESSGRGGRRFHGKWIPEKQTGKQNSNSKRWRRRRRSESELILLGSVFWMSLSSFCDSICRFVNLWKLKALVSSLPQVILWEQCSRSFPFSFIYIPLAPAPICLAYGVVWFLFKYFFFLERKYTVIP